MKLKFKKLKSQLDEMQEQQLYKSDRIVLFVTILGLIIAIMVQGVMGADFSQIAGECFVLNLLCFVGIINSIKNGIWSRFYKIGIKSYLLYSLLAAIIVSLFDLVMCIANGPIKTIAVDTISVFAITFGFTLTGYLILGKIFKMRIKKLEEDCSE